MDKVFKAVLLVNWKNGDVAIRKKKPKHLGAYVIPVKLALTMKMPEEINPEISATITISEPKVMELFVEEVTS